ncbi:thioredoxin [Microlunatus soli]|uniref:Thioredoxin n=1 Tax=Microlunatus soli TaxID=630515 RepID=A0A1H2AFR0_9ACTN|nr:thioredoxin [Microlunatus soli]SDT44835.1 thioredoxin [Microlunatus soli]
MQTLTTENFDATLEQSTLPVLVDFWAEWCPPCKVMDPILDQLQKELADRLLVAKINSDEHPQISARYRVLGLPTMLLFVGGEPALSIKGARSKRALMSQLEPHLVATAVG